MVRFSPDVNQFSIITELIGTPPDDVIKTICSENVRPFPPLPQVCAGLFGVSDVSSPLVPPRTDSPLRPVPAQARTDPA